MAGLFTSDEILQEFENGDVEPPGLIPWKEWQSWRAVLGRRPAIRRGDAAGTTIKEEVSTWREVMAAYAGPDWEIELRTQNQDAALAGSSDLLGDDSAHPEGSDAGPAALDGGQLGAEQSDGVDADGAPTLETVPERQSAAGASRSKASDGVCPSAPGLRQRLHTNIDLTKETADEFVARISRLAIALDNLGDPVAAAELAEITSRGEYTAMLQALAGDSQVTMLKDLFNVALTNDSISESDRAGKCRALIVLLRARGQHVSTDAERMFSTATNSPFLTPERPLAPGARTQYPSNPVVPKPKVHASAIPPRTWMDGGVGGSGLPTLHGGGLGGPSTPRANGVSSGGLDTPRGRNRDFDETSNASAARDDAMAEALQTQTKALTLVMQTMATIAEKQSTKKLSSTIRVNPTIQWPKLSDDGPDCREVERFFESFDETCGLANDGAGMSDKERLKVLSGCLKGARERTYQNQLKKHRALGDVENDPGKVFDVIKAKLI